MPFQVDPAGTRVLRFFEAAARNVAEAIGELVALIDEVPTLTLRVERIRRAGARGDDFTHEIIKTLNQTFVTPIDRHDIHALASALDDVLDYRGGRWRTCSSCCPSSAMFPQFRTLVEVLAA